MDDWVARLSLKPRDLTVGLKLRTGSITRKCRVVTASVILTGLVLKLLLNLEIPDSLPILGASINTMNRGAWYVVTDGQMARFFLISGRIGVVSPGELRLTHNSAATTRGVMLLDQVTKNVVI